MQLYVAGTLYCQATADSRGRSTHRHTSSPDISMLSQELQEQRHVERNKHLGGIEVKPHGNMHAVWQCNKCPAGQLHVWTAKVSSRRQGTKCPYCSNRLVCLHNSLAIVAPDVAQSWNHSKNKRSPQQVLAGSNLRAEWKCPSCYWEWPAPPSNRTRYRSGCPKCSQAARSPQSQPTFAKAWPPEFDAWAMTQRASIQIRSLLAATKRCTGSACAVQKGSHTAGELAK